MAYYLMRTFAASSYSRTDRRMRAAAFTMLEVMVATIVLVFTITSSITVMQSGFQALDTARNLTTAGQVLENEMENLRLKNWAQIQALEDAGNTIVAPDPRLGAAATRFTCTRTISDLKADMKQITLTTTWSGADGRTHTASYLTRYGKNGLNDYSYTVH
jgi:type II secretory pathway pseudopilin PulG